jgi:hypothetical protein
MRPSNVPKADKVSPSGGDKGKRREVLSLYPLSLETALGAALKTGKPPEMKKKKPVDKSKKD